MKSFTKDEVLKTEAIVIGSTRYKESDRIITVFTKEYGKLKIIVKGARKINSKYSSGVLPVSHIDVQLIKKNSDFFIISGFCPLDEYSDLRADYTKIISILKILNIFDEITVERVRNTDEFYLLLEVFALFRKINSEIKIEIYFILRFLNLSGFGLNMEHCIGCKKEYVKGPLQLFYKEGIVCHKCKNMFDNQILLTEAEFVILKKYSEGIFVTDNFDDKKFINFTRKYLNFHLEKKLKIENIF